MKLIHFQCPACNMEFWTKTRPPNLNCPNPICRCGWSPTTMDGWFERGNVEEFEQVSKKIWKPKQSV